MTTAHMAMHVASWGLPPPAHPRTLADVRPGESVRVAAVAPGSRDLLADLGVHAGARIQCESAARYLVVRTRSGCVPLEHGLAAAVRVAALADEGDTGR